MDVNIIIKSMTNITPTAEQIQRIEELRNNYKALVIVVNKNCQDSRCKSIAMTDIENSLMWAVKSIVMEENNK